MKRREARVQALQLLYQLDLDPRDPETLLEEWEKETQYPQWAKDFIRRLVKGVWEKKEEIDGHIQRFSTKWRIDRMDRVDRNILRIGTFEILYCHDIPIKVAINEAVEMAKKFGSSEDSKGFINAILDKIAKTIPKEEKEDGKGQKHLDERRAGAVG
jgi:N utilization substance protein B